MAVQPFLPFGVGDALSRSAVADSPPGSPESSAAPAPSASAPSPPSAARGVSRLIEELGRICAELPLEEKILVVPSLAIGHQTIERLALAGHRPVHLRVETVRNLAHATVGPAISREGRRLLSRAQSLALIEQACGETLVAGSYFGPLGDRPGFHRALAGTFDELKAAGLSPGALPEAAFADPRKPRELRTILLRYETALEKGHWIDRAEVLRRAAEAVDARPPRKGALFLLPEGSDLTTVERRFLERLAAGRLTPVPTDPPETWTDNAARSRIFRAIGEENEIRAVFRTLLESGTPFDEAEILHTDPATYPALAFELAAEHGIPCTFSGGIAAAFTRPGQAALAFLRWIGGGFEADALREALASGLLTFPKGEGGPATGPMAAARELRRARVGWGRDRHLSALDRHVAEIEALPQRDEEEDEAAGRPTRRERRIAATRAARAFVARALDLAPAASAVDLASLSRGTREFVSEFARVTGDLDATSQSALSTLFEEFESLPGEPVPRERAVERLSDAVLALHVAPDRPRPGRLHFAEYRSGGFSGRRQTFLIGFDEKRHPGGGREDPVLSDEERGKINALAAAGLSLGPQRARENSTAARACVARLRGEVTFGFAGWNLRDLANPGEVFPSPFLLEIFRRASGEAEADYARFAASVSNTEGFLPGAARSLDETEWWLSRIGDARGPETEATVDLLHPWLSDGRRAQEARRSSELTPWDAVFRRPVPELDPRINGRPMSSSRIQALAECPYGYFLAHVLRLASPDEKEEDATEWLDPRTVGSLIHAVFRRFLEDLVAAGRLPEFPRDLAALDAIADDEILAMRKKVPPRSELAMSRTREDIRFACRTFLISEAARSAEVQPVAFEVAFGMKPGVEPVEIPLGAGRSFRLRGSIDRVDRAPDGTFHVWDYKTGTSAFTREERGIAAGRQIQPALYALAYEALLARAGKPGRVSESGYFFPGRRGLGERFTISPSAEETRRTLNTLFDLLAAGAFLHSPEKDSDCFVCRDLTGFCPDREEAGRRSSTLLKDAKNPVLTAWRNLRGL